MVVLNSAACDVLRGGTLNLRVFFTNVCIIVQMSAKIDDVVRKPARAAEIRKVFCI